MKIGLIVAVTLVFMGCSEEKSSTAKEEIGNSLEKITQVVQEESDKIGKSVEKATEDSVEIVTKEVKEVSTKVLQETKEVAEKTADSIDEVLKTPTKEVAVSGPDGAKLFSKCSSCHGVNADKTALNKSRSIRGWSVEKLTTAINGYKDGTYGGSMKGVMKPQVNNLNDAEIQAIAEHISKL